MNLPDNILDEIIKNVENEIDNLPEDNNGKDHTFDSLEKLILDARNRFGQKLMEKTLEYENSKKKTEKKCPDCSSKLRDKGFKIKYLLCLLGLIKLKRTLLKCTNCKKSFYFFDDRLEISRSMVSKYLAKIISLVSIFVPFKHSVKIIKDILRINASETLLQKIAHKIGDKLYKDVKNKKAEEIEVDENVLDIDLLYIQADGSMVPISKAEKIEYKENKLGVVFTNKDITEKKKKNGEMRIEIKNKRFVSSLGKGVDEFKDMLNKTAIEKGSDHSKKIIFLCDGAVWLNNFKNDYYPDAIRILDWYHTVDHLWTTAHKIYGQNSDKCLKWIKPLKDKLWDGKVEETIEYLTELAMNSKNQTPIWELKNYYENNKDAMMYNEYRDAGYYIGSGTIESANKYLVANRLKQAGMRWSIDGANSMIWLRSKYFEDRWDGFWEEMKLPEYLNKEELGKIAA